MNASASDDARLMCGELIKQQIALEPEIFTSLFVNQTLDPRTCEGAI